MLYVPPIETKEVACSTDSKHLFCRKGVPSRLRIYCMHLDEPLAGLPYKMVIDGRIIKGKTGPKGLVEEPIPPDAREGFLVIQKKEREFRYDLDFGHLDPLETTTGVKARLANLGFDPGPIDQEERPEFTSALNRFQEKYGLEQTGKPDPPTLDKLDQVHR